MAVREYKDRHGLPRSKGLTSREYNRRLSDRAKARLGTAGWKSLEARRDPKKAAQARDFAPLTGSARVNREKTAAKNIQGQSKPVSTYACIICGTEFLGAHQKQLCDDRQCAAIYRYRISGKGIRGHKMVQKHEAGQDYSALGREYDMTPQGARYAVRRYQDHIQDVHDMQRRTGAEILRWENP